MDCLVIGGGINGLLSARELARAGLSVTLLERGRTGREASWAAGGILSPLYPWRHPAPVTVLARWSQTRYPTLVRELREQSGTDPEYSPSGVLILDDAEGLPALAWARDEGYSLRTVAAPEAARIEPALGGAGAVSLWMPEIAQIRPPRLLQALRRSVVESGVELREGTPVTALDHAGGCIRGVRTETGAVACDTVVLAAGAWSGSLLEGLLPALRVEPVRGQMLVLRGPGTIPRRIVLHEGRYLIPRRDGLVLAGSTLEFTGFEKSTSDAARRDLYGAAVRMVPALAGAELIAHWAGLRPGSPQGVPWIGPHPALRGLFVNTGQYRNGMVLAPASAQLLSDLVLGREPVLPAYPYDPGRVREGAEES